MKENQLIQQLTDYYRTHRLDLTDPTVSLEWVNHEGWESEIYGFILTHGTPGERTSVPRVLRLLTGSNLEEARKEYETLRLLSKAGYPVPEVFDLGRLEEGFEQPFIIMQEIKGSSLADRIWENGGINPHALEEFIGLFRWLHTLDWRFLIEDPEQVAPKGKTYYFFERKLAFYNHHLPPTGFEGFQAALQWLAQQRDQVPCDTPSLVHGDFHPDNILESQDGKLYVIDWTSAEISDYRFDLAWTLTLACQYGGEIRRERIRAEYERQFGGRVPALDIFEIIAILGRIGSVMLSFLQGAESLGMRPEAVQSMRKDQDSMIRLYQRFQNLSGKRVLEVEKFLEGMN